LGRSNFTQAPSMMPPFPSSEPMVSSISPSDYISCKELRDLVETVFTDPNRRILIFDVRPRCDYDRSHVCFDMLFLRRPPQGTEKNRIRVMNVDVMQIKPATISKIKAILGEEDLRIFDKRSHASDVIVIAPKQTTTMPQEARFMIDALTKWDTSEDKIRVAPKLLRGGFIDWHYSYPQYATEPQDDPDPISTASFKRPAISVTEPIKSIPEPSKSVCPEPQLLFNDASDTPTPVIPSTQSILTPGVPKPLTISTKPPVSVPLKSVTSNTATTTKQPLKERNITAVPKQPKPVMSTLSSNLSNATGLLSRSHSSPNVAQEDGDESSVTLSTNPSESTKPLNRPAFNRAHKPIGAVAHSARDTETLRYLLSQLNFEPLAHGTVGQSMTGLKNLGNTCFMNSVIQCLAYAPPMSYYFGKMNYLNHVNFNSQFGSKGELAIQFGALIEQLNNHQYRSLTPKSFREAVVKHIGFAGCDQQDSHEFMMMLFEKLHHDLNVHAAAAQAAAQAAKDKAKQQRNGNNNTIDLTDCNDTITKTPMCTQINGDCTNLSPMATADMGYRFWKRHVELNRSIVSETFEGMLMSTLTCSVCDTQSSTFELFNCLSLPIPSDTKCTLQECLAHFSKPERIEAAWECSRCKVKREAVKKIVICKLPKILIVHLKRFSQDGPWRQKLQTDVEFPLENLNVEYISALPPSAYPSSGGQPATPPMNGGATKSNRYDLYAVVNHYGTLDGGHYTSFCHVHQWHGWYKFDDNEVSEMNKANVCTKGAYILFYASQSGYFPSKNPVPLLTVDN
ncbi:Ubiquitin carboxyl-terminal hydrolase 8, partial [Fragariocoptes setiger]